MIAFGRELLCEVVQEVQPLLELHHAELGTKYQLDPQWHEYHALERLGRFVVFTAREGGVLTGYAAFHVIRHLQSAGFVQAMNDCFYVVPNARIGATVLRFVRYAEGELKAAGAKQVAFLASPHNSFASLLHRIGYESEQTLVAKMI